MVVGTDVFRRSRRRDHGPSHRLAQRGISNPAKPARVGRSRLSQDADALRQSGLNHSRDVVLRPGSSSSWCSSGAWSAFWPMAKPGSDGKATLGVGILHKRPICASCPTVAPSGISGDRSAADGRIKKTRQSRPANARSQTTSTSGQTRAPTHHLPAAAARLDAKLRSGTLRVSGPTLSGNRARIGLTKYPHHRANAWSPTAGDVGVTPSSDCLVRAASRQRQRHGHAVQKNPQDPYGQSADAPKWRRFCRRNRLR